MKRITGAVVYCKRVEMDGATPRSKADRAHDKVAEGDDDAGGHDRGGDADLVKVAGVEVSVAGRGQDQRQLARRQVETRTVVRARPLD